MRRKYPLAMLGTALERFANSVGPELRTAVRRRLPAGIYYRILLRTRRLPSPIDTAPLRRIASEPPERLSDPVYLAEDLLPAMGLHGAAGVFPPELRSRVGTGVHHFQVPVQLGPYLVSVAQAGVTSYLEIGVGYGGTFAITVEILRKLGALQRAIAVDLGPTPRLFRDWSRPEANFVAVNSHSAAFARLVAERGPFDLVFIDGDHTDAGVRQDFETVRPHARMIAFHDIVEPAFPGVGRVWADIRARHAGEYDFREFVAAYEGGPSPLLGIGLATRRDVAPA
jgi:hypothetical protein